MSGSVSQFEQVVVDTVVVNYFLALGRIALLAAVVGGCVLVPRAVYDPDETDRADVTVVSELERGLRRHRQRAVDPELAPKQREYSSEALPHFERLQQHVGEGLIVPLSLDPSELQLYGMFRDAVWAREHGLLAELGSGEAAALAVAENRGMRLATDDQDCIRLAQARRPDSIILRIRSVLHLAVDAGLVGFDEARSIHLSMRARGFWDRGQF